MGLETNPHSGLYFIDYLERGRKGGRETRREGERKRLDYPLPHVHALTED